jgi:ATP-dependent DNA ligase
MDAEKVKKCVWVRPEVVVQISFLEWTGKDHLRVSKFVRLREDKSAAGLEGRSVENLKKQERMRSDS